MHTCALKRRGQACTIGNAHESREVIAGAILPVFSVLLATVERSGYGRSATGHKAMPEVVRGVLADGTPLIGLSIHSRGDMELVLSRIEEQARHEAAGADAAEAAARALDPRRAARQEEAAAKAAKAAAEQAGGGGGSGAGGSGSAAAMVAAAAAAAAAARAAAARAAATAPVDVKPPPPAAKPPPPPAAKRPQAPAAAAPLVIDLVDSESEDVGGAVKEEQGPRSPSVKPERSPPPPLSPIQAARQRQQQAYEASVRASQSPVAAAVKREPAAAAHEPLLSPPAAAPAAAAHEPLLSPPAPASASASARAARLLEALGDGADDAEELAEVARLIEARRAAAMAAARGGGGGRGRS